MLNGLKPTIGLDEKTEQAVVKRMADSELKKKNRALRRKNRKK